jgi:hypothetical protein
MSTTMAVQPDAEVMARLKNPAPSKSLQSGGHRSGVEQATCPRFGAGASALASECRAERLGSRDACGHPPAFGPERTPRRAGVPWALRFPTLVATTPMGFVIVEPTGRRQGVSTEEL